MSQSPVVSTSAVAAAAAMGVTVTSDRYGHDCREGVPNGWRGQPLLQSAGNGVARSSARHRRPSPRRRRPDLSQLRAHPLAPVDRHGWIDRNRTLTARSLNDRLHCAVLAAPAHDATVASAATPLRSAELILGSRDRAALAELDALLTRLESALDDVALDTNASRGNDAS